MGKLVKIIASAIKFNLIFVAKNRHEIYTQCVIIVPNMTILGQNINEQNRLTDGRTDGRTDERVTLNVLN